MLENSLIDIHRFANGIRSEERLETYKKESKLE